MHLGDWGVKDVQHGIRNALLIISQISINNNLFYTSTFICIGSDEDPTLEAALVLLEPAAELGLHPDDGAPITLAVGKFGPYVRHGNLMASVPKARLSLRPNSRIQCLDPRTFKSEQPLLSRLELCRYEVTTMGT